MAEFPIVRDYPHSIRKVWRAMAGIGVFAMSALLRAVRGGMLTAGLSALLGRDGRNRCATSGFAPALKVIVGACR
ncbi:hypothetical protein [Nocardia sp. NPDC051570]|uniref:hypothetical protein n=1 Tax=Nocardia sp. NPDC051570 TaxID=3364324 RepID=UPI0037931B05